MASAARERLAEMLGGEAAPAASSVQLKAKTDELHLEVQGAGRVQLPVPAEQARQLCQLGQPAQFGRGEETLTDPQVRDTWEIPKSLVRIEWSGAFGTILDAVRDELGLPSCCELAADLPRHAGVRTGPVLRRAPGFGEGRHDDRYPGGDVAVRAHGR